MMKKRIFSMFLAVVLLLSLVPVQSNAATVNYQSNSKNNTTITVHNEGGQRISDAQITVTRSNSTYEVYAAGNGQYKFTRDRTSRNYTYTIVVSAPGYQEQTVSMKGNNASLNVELEAETVEIIPFRVYYISSGIVPNSYSGTGDPKDYGPSANDTPLVLLDVDVTALRKLAAETNSPVVYVEKPSYNSNQYEFIPAGNRTDSDYLAKVRAFWNAVLTCATEESIVRFEETGLFDTYMAYCLKKQSGGSYHCDGVLDVVPPVYVVELYENQKFFGGGVSDSAAGSKFLTRYDILDQYDAHLKKNITWVEGKDGKPELNANGEFTGHYIENHKIYEIKVYQTNYAQAKPVDGSEIPYVKQTENYYLAKYNMSISAGVQIQHKVTYSDGVTGEVIFTDHEYPANEGAQVPAYTGITVREGYNFTGWTLEGDTTGKLYSDADIANMKVEKDMVFYADWEPIPEYVGTVKVVLNGTFDSTTGTLTSEDSLVDLGSILGVDENNVTIRAHIVGSNQNENHVILNRESTGTYSAILDNGTYHICYSIGGADHVHLGDQHMVMQNANRTRYVFFNSVSYDANGGTLTGAALEYYLSGSRVEVASAPTRAGYIFRGWKLADGTLLQPGDKLVESIDRPYALTAQWEKEASIYVTVIMNHKGNVDMNRDDVNITISSYKDGYHDIYTKALTGEGTEGYTYAVEQQDEINVITTYTPTAPNLTGRDGANEFYIGTDKANYRIVGVERTEKDGDLYFTLTLEFVRDTFDFQYSVTLDDDSKLLPKETWPKAVNVQVVRWNGSKWVPVNGMANGYQRVVLNENGEGAGAYAVLKTPEDGYFRYRIAVVSYELQDGTMVPAIDGGDYINYNAEKDLYDAKVEVTGGATPNNATVPGAYYEGNGQKGAVQAIVSIPTFKVTFDPNGGKFGESGDAIVLTEQIYMANPENYIPTRNDYYTFGGWQLVGEGEIPAAGGILTKDITLKAIWKEPITVEGIVTVGATYELDGILREMHDSTLPKSVTVLLQKKLPTGYYETIKEMDAKLDYTQTAYFFKGVNGDENRKVGLANYQFANLPDDGAEYRITILLPNYTATYQNEPASVDAEKQYNTYTATMYNALLNGDKTAVVNAHMHFNPDSFELKYQVDASAIGEAFRPENAEVLVTFKDNPAIVEPENWTVISQMIIDGELKGEVVTLAEGIGNDSYPVWKYEYSGITLYDYGIRLLNVDGEAYVENDYYEVTYQDPAHFHETTGEQSQLLIAYLTPKTYNINYHTNGGSILGNATHTHTHTWSKATQLNDIVPVRNGYRFGGWYFDKDLTDPVPEDYVIPADYAADVDLYAKWTQVNIYIELFIDHDYHFVHDHGKELTLQLTARSNVPSASESLAFKPMEGHSHVIGLDEWHTRGDHVQGDSLELHHLNVELPVDMDYSATATLDGYSRVNSYTYQLLSGEYETVKTETVKTVEVDEFGSTVITHNIVICLKYQRKNIPTITFHANNPDASYDIFRTYLPAGTEIDADRDGFYNLNEDGSLNSFYDIPEFAYATHNNYIFAGWYTEPTGGEPISWDAKYFQNGNKDDVHIYAHWITTGTVEKEEADTKKTSSNTYPGYDLIGAQIRDKDADGMTHYGNPGSGLRFVTVLSEDVYTQINALPGNASGAEYGFVLAKASTAAANATGENYTLQYAGTNVNGVDTSATYSYVKNVKCSGVIDHYDGENYRLYTAVITYSGLEGDALTDAYNTNFLARSYIRYYDANGLLRTYYNNYTGTPTYNGLSTSFTTIRELTLLRNRGAE